MDRNELRKKIKLSVCQFSSMFMQIKSIDDTSKVLTERTIFKFLEWDKSVKWKDCKIKHLPEYLFIKFLKEIDKNRLQPYRATKYELKNIEEKYNTFAKDHKKQDAILKDYKRGLLPRSIGAKNGQCESIINKVIEVHTGRQIKGQKKQRKYQYREKIDSYGKIRINEIEGAKITNIKTIPMKGKTYLALQDVCKIFKVEQRFVVFLGRHMKIDYALIDGVYKYSLQDLKKIKVRGERLKYVKV